MIVNKHIGLRAEASERRLPAAFQVRDDRAGYGGKNIEAGIGMAVPGSSAAIDAEGLRTQMEAIRLIPSSVAVG